MRYLLPVCEAFCLFFCVARQEKVVWAVKKQKKRLNVA
ncbi:hypothetical protein PU02_0383 [Bartonella ancashensis]|uniref:Uncharacterized protein n=1 Tax=Bartonella ancashensis TaxID=1318743 RepID=A0A0M4LS53_9HYPH|nr:hypothetical protein PU02_0383 [Bartonella ancashensis]